MNINLMKKTLPLAATAILTAGALTSCSTTQIKDTTLDDRKIELSNSIDSLKNVYKIKAMSSDDFIKEAEEIISTAKPEQTHGENARAYLFLTLLAFLGSRITLSAAGTIIDTDSTRYRKLSKIIGLATLLSIAYTGKKYFVENKAQYEINKQFENYKTQEINSIKELKF